MGLFGWLGSVFGDPSYSCGTTINPASGLPMLDGSCGVDVAGNPYGTDNGSTTDSGISTIDTGSSLDSGIGSTFGDSFSSFDSSSSFNDW